MAVNQAPNGIRYGTIYLNKIDSDVAHDLWQNGTDLTYKRAVEGLEAEIRFELAQEAWPEDEREDEFQRRFERQCDQLVCDEPTIEGEKDGVKYIIGHLGGAALLWITESPFTGEFALCSPCVPGAVSIGQPGAYLGYDVPADWRAE